MEIGYFMIYGHSENVIEVAVNRASCFDCKDKVGVYKK